MQGPLINREILNAVSEKTAGDPLLQKFIQELLFEELEHQSLWWFKDHYKKKVREYSQKWAKENENQQLKT